MTKILPLLLLLCCFGACRNDDDNETDDGNGIIIDEDGLEEDVLLEATTWYPTKIDAEWTYRQFDSINRTVDSFDLLERVDSCCHYIGLYRLPDMSYMGWRWLAPDNDVMWTNGGSRLMNTQYINEPKGSWKHLDSSSTSDLESVKEIATGTYSLTTRVGKFDCIKTRMTNTFKDREIIHEYHYAPDIGWVKERIEYWDGFSGNRYLAKTTVRVITSFDTD